MLPHASRPAKPLLVFDGVCGFCRRWVERWRATLGERMDVAPYQHVAERYPSVPRGAFREAVHLLLPTGKVMRGAAAVFQALALRRGGGTLLALYRHLPGFAAASEWCYRQVARHRVLASRVTRVLAGPDLTPVRYRHAAWLYLRLLGVVFAVAFASLLVQWAGLFGSKGLLPAEETVARLREAGIAFRQAPTLFWLGASDAALRTALFGGLALSALLLLGIVPRWALLALWALYGSFLPVSGPFLGFQWDALLLEAAFVSWAVAPAGLRPGANGGAGALFLPRFLLFKLMLLSGAVKLASGDAAWWSLRALEAHFWTQPLPTPLGMLAGTLPAGLLRASTLVMFVIELVLPFGIWGTRRMRRGAALGLVLLQVLIALTGNYGFFNLLTLVLCVTLVDDAVWARLVPRWRGPVLPLPDAPPAWRRWGLTAFATLVVGMSVAVSLQRLGAGRRLPGPLETALDAVTPFTSVHAYGLFAVMTTERPEVELEGSLDGEQWRAYAFRYKPGPVVVAPHMPRLDWQMWFAALGSCRSNPWLVRLQARLLTGSPPVLALLKRDPFDGQLPRFMRTTLVMYRPAAGGTWAREPVGPYCPMLERTGDVPR